jgi:hypothetical protein
MSVAVVRKFGLMRGAERGELLFKLTVPRLVGDTKFVPSVMYGRSSVVGSFGSR